jgi:hypothetical protein
LSWAKALTTARVSDKLKIRTEAAGISFFRIITSREHLRRFPRTSLTRTLRAQPPYSTTRCRRNPEAERGHPALILPQFDRPGVSPRHRSPPSSGEMSGPGRIATFRCRSWSP